MGEPNNFHRLRHPDILENTFEPTLVEGFLIQWLGGWKKDHDSALFPLDFVSDFSNLLKLFDTYHRL